VAVPVVEARQLVKTYVMEDVEVRALRGVDVTIEQGEFVALVGPSGSGKSTLMHILGCLDVPTSGEVLIDGEPISELSENKLAELRNRRIGFVFQAFNLLTRTSALDNVEMPLIYSGVSMGDRRRAATAALERVGLGDRLGHFSSQLSGGQQQRVAIARALVTDPSLILADEPTGNLDSRSGCEIMETLQELNDAGITIVLVTHDLAIAAHAKRVIELRDGRIVRSEPVEDRKLACVELEEMPAEEDEDEPPPAVSEVKAPKKRSFRREKGSPE
jgi:putative ABC transport system ATP-binding protein